MIEIGQRKDVEKYRMRSVPGGYPGDLVHHHHRVIGGTRYDFAHIKWGDGSVTVSVTNDRTSELIHCFETISS